MTLSERIDSHTIYVPFSGCRLWTGYVNWCGYGRIFVNHKVQFVHRVVWQIERGEIPDGLRVLHKCDVPSCCNIDHLFLGTMAENSADMLSKKRNSPMRGERNGRSKLTEADVLMARDDKRTCTAVAAELGVTPWVISRLRRGLSWRYLNKNTS